MLILKLINILDLLTHLNKRYILQYNLYFANQTSKQSKKNNIAQTQLASMISVQPPSTSKMARGLFVSLPTCGPPSPAHNQFSRRQKSCR